MAGWPRFVAAFLGSSLYWTLTRYKSLFFVLAGHDACASECFMWYVVFILLVIGTVVVGCMAEKVTYRVLSASRLPILFVFGLGAVLKVIDLTASFGTVPDALISCLDVGTYAIGYVLLTCMWASWYVNMRTRDALLTLMASFALNFVLNAPLRLVTPDGLVESMILVGVPLASAVLWCLGDVDLNPFSSAFHPSARKVLEDRPTAVIIWCFVTLLVIGGVIRGLVRPPISGDMMTGPFTQDLVTVAFIGVLLISCLNYRSVPMLFQFLWALVTVVFVGGLLLVGSVVPGNVSVAEHVVVMARTCTMLLLWIVLVNTCRRKHLSLVNAFGVFFVVVDAISGLLGYVVVPMVLAALGADATGATPVACAVGVFAMLVTLMLYFSYLTGGAREVADPVPDGAGSTMMGPDPKVGDLAAPDSKEPDVSGIPGMADLTEREAMLARYLGEGYSQKRAAELMGIGLGTVQTHAKSLYRKLGIHSRQELVELLHPTGQS